MAYNFPLSYQPAQIYYPTPQPVQPQQAPQTPQTTQNNNIIWVSGETGAKAYLVAPNTTVQLWDSEEQVIYLKSADASGMPSIKTLDYTVREPSASRDVVLDQKQEYVSKEEINALEEKIEALRNDIDKIASSKKKGD